MITALKKRKEKRDFLHKQIAPSRNVREGAVTMEKFSMYVFVR